MLSVNVRGRCFSPHVWSCIFLYGMMYNFPTLQCEAEESQLMYDLLEHLCPCFGGTSEAIHRQACATEMCLGARVFRVKCHPSLFLLLHLALWFPLGCSESFPLSYCWLVVFKADPLGRKIWYTLGAAYP